MEAKKLFVVVGTDARQAAAGRVLERAGYAVGGAEQVALADYILLPLPLDAALIQQSGLCFEDAVAVLQKLAAGEKITG
jgi:hypothetical protein